MSWHSDFLLINDPKLWFNMMFMPTGLPALVILGLAELAHASRDREDGYRKALNYLKCFPRFIFKIESNQVQNMYVLSPFICFKIRGAPKVSEAALVEPS